METNLKFNTKKCLDYINSIADFKIEFERKPTIDLQSDTVTYLAERLNMKVHLKKFIVECRKESQQDDYDFLQWLNERRNHWKSQEYRIMGALHDRTAEATDAADKAEIERKKFRYRSFFSHNFKLIEMIEHDVLNALDMPDIYLPPSDGLQHPQRAAVQSFDELFREGRDAAPYFALLSEHEYPLIGEQFNYVSRALKSGFCIWIYELQRQHIIEHRPDKVYAELLLKKITGLKVFDSSIFRKTNNRAELLYKEYFQSRIAQLKALS